MEELGQRFAATPPPQPHLLIMSGDQIYADEVGHPLMPRVLRVAQDLIGIDETDLFGPPPPIGGRGPGTDALGYTGARANHLWTYGEFMAMYLLAWSPVLWPGTLPAFPTTPTFPPDVDPGVTKESWDSDLLYVELFRAALPDVRRVLANVPSLMIFDDHEITDDWNLDHPWVNSVYDKPGGRRAVTNGVLAYALCQHWGNKPQAFTTASTPEQQVLDTVAAAAATSPPTSPATACAPLLGLPTGPLPDAPPPQALRDLTAPNAIRYDLTLGPDEGWPVRIVLFDERTVREYPRADSQCARISRAALAVQLPPPASPVPFTIVVAAAPILGTELVEDVIQPLFEVVLPGGARFADFESWSAVRANHQDLLARLAAHDPVVVLSGDVHYGFTAKLTRSEGGATTRVAQLTASAAKNVETKNAAISLFSELIMRLGLERARATSGFASLSNADKTKLLQAPRHRRAAGLGRHRRRPPRPRRTRGRVRADSHPHAHRRGLRAGGAGLDLRGRARRRPDARLRRAHGRRAVARLGPEQVVDDDRRAPGSRPRALRADVRRAAAARGGVVHARGLVAHRPSRAALPRRPRRARPGPPRDQDRGAADMTDVVRPVLGPLTTVTGEVIDTARAERHHGLADPALRAWTPRTRCASPRILEDLAAAAALTLNARSQDEFCNALRAWGDALVELAEVVLTPLAAAGVVGLELTEALVIELLRFKLPRLASMLSLAGAIVEDPGLGSRFDWERLRDFMLVTPELVDETFWDDLFGEADMETSGRMPALLAAMLIVAPETISALNAGTLRIAPLAPPPTPTDASPQWKSLRERSTGWIPITFPLRTVDGHLTLSDPPDLRGGFDPELAISLLIRSQRRPAGGRTVTDFEMWLHPSGDAERHELRTSAGFITALEPGVRAGVGYDGGATDLERRESRRGPARPAANEATLQIRRDTTEGHPDLIFGPPYDTRVVARDLSLEVRLRELGEPSVEVVGRADGFGLVVTNRWLRSLGENGSTLREGLRFDVDLEARLTEGAGFSFSAEGALTTRIHLGKSLHPQGPQAAGPLDPGQRPDPRRPGSLRHARRGAAALVGDGRAGHARRWTAPAAGSDGGRTCRAATRSASGCSRRPGSGCCSSCPAVTGGGFLDFTGGPNDHYAGVLTLTVGPPKGLSRWTVTAFGIHELTGDPDALDRDRTFVLVIGTSFRPGVHLAYGIYWIGAGGIVGINRRADTDALRERLTSGAVGNILFAEDPVRNAPILLGDLGALFPPAPGLYVFGLTMQLGWVPLLEEYLARLAIGVIVEFDSQARPTKVVVLGSLVIKIPRPREVPRHRDRRRRHLRYPQAHARDRRHDPPRPAHGRLHGHRRRRPALELGRHAVPDGHDRRASTPTSIPSPPSSQAQADPHHRRQGRPARRRGAQRLRLHGDHLEHDPVRGRVHRRDQGRQLEDRGQHRRRRPDPHALPLRRDDQGRRARQVPRPQPHRGEVQGWAGRPVAARPPRRGVHRPALLRRVLERQLRARRTPAPSSARPSAAWCPCSRRSWRKPVQSHGHRGRRPARPAARHDDSDRVVLTALGVPTWSQNRVPLGLAIETFEDGKLDEPQRLEVHATVPTTPHVDWFSPGSFVELSEAEELALPAFERQQAGVVVSLPGRPGRPAATTAPSSYEEIRLPRTRRTRRRIRDPWARAGADAGDRGAPPGDPPAARRASASARTASGRGATRGRRSPRRRRGRGAPRRPRDARGATQHAADRLVAVVAG